MPVVRRINPTAGVYFIAPLDRYAEIRASLPELKKELSSKWPVTRLNLWIRNPVHVPSQAEIHLFVESTKDYAYLAGLGYAMWCFLKKRFPWIKKPKARARTRKKPRRR